MVRLCSQFYNTFTVVCTVVVMTGSWLEFQDYQQHAVDMLLAEIDVYEMFYFKHCDGRKIHLSLCEGTVYFRLEWY